MPFELKNTHSKLQTIINDIFSIDNVLLFLKSITKHFNNLITKVSQYHLSHVSDVAAIVHPQKM